MARLQTDTIERTDLIRFEWMNRFRSIMVTKYDFPEFIPRFIRADPEPKERNKPIQTAQLRNFPSPDSC